MREAPKKKFKVNRAAFDYGKSSHASNTKQKKMRQTLPAKNKNAGTNILFWHCFYSGIKSMTVNIARAVSGQQT